MKQSFFNNKMMGLLVLVALSLSACAKKDGSGVRTAGRANINGTTAVQTGTCNTNSAGKIFDLYGSNSFETQVKAFVDATMAGDSFGSISGNISASTGIDLYVTFKFDHMGALVPAESKMLMKIFDSYVGQSYQGQVVQPYAIQFDQAASGQIDRNTRQFQVSFADSYGEIIYKGSYNDSIAEGTVYFVNRTSVSGNPKSGTLGTFRVYACSLIK